MKLKGIFTFFISKLRLPHLHNIIPTYIFLADGAGLSQQVGFPEHVFEASQAMHTKKHSTVALPIFTSGIESVSSSARTYHEERTLYKMLLLTKHFNLTKLFSLNISFYISYPQLYSTAINHINRLSVRNVSWYQPVNKI